MRIQKIVAENPPLPNGKGLYPLTRKMIPVGAMESEEEGDNDEGPEDDEYVPGANNQVQCFSSMIIVLSLTAFME